MPYVHVTLQDGLEPGDLVFLIDVLEGDDGSDLAGVGDAAIIVDVCVDPKDVTLNPKMMCHILCAGGTTHSFVYKDEVVRFKDEQSKQSKFNFDNDGGPCDGP